MTRRVQDVFLQKGKKMQNNQKNKEMFDKVSTMYDISKADLARLLNVSVNNWNYYEQNKAPYHESFVIRLNVTLGMPWHKIGELLLSRNEPVIADALLRKKIWEQGRVKELSRVVNIDNFRREITKKEKGE